MGLEWNDPTAYDQGRAYAHQVQHALAQGQTFEEIPAFPPGEAKRYKACVEKARPGHADILFWKGYLSKWD